MRRIRLASFYNQKGLTTVEYAMAGALIAAVLVTAFDGLGAQIGVLINFLIDAFS